jgi:hypothetical protein
MWLGCPKARIRLQAEIGGEVRALNIGLFKPEEAVNGLVAQPLQIAPEP